MAITYVDLDDFSEYNHSLDLLLKIKEKIPGFKVTLFTVVGNCTEKFLVNLSELKWLDLVPHGMFHRSNRECESWSRERALEYLKFCSELPLKRGFKAPGWQISDGCYQALLERGYWVMDQTYNNPRRPPDLPAYLVESPGNLHGHIGNLNGENPNELSRILPQILSAKNEEFGLIDAYLRYYHPSLR